MYIVYKTNASLKTDLRLGTVCLNFSK
jgi:hypothetical protein